MIKEEFELPSGLKVKNRLVKAAMTEGLSDEFHKPTEALCNLYRLWAKESGCGTLITGNLQVDRRFLERPRNVVVDKDYSGDDEDLLEKLKEYAEAGKENDTRIIAQIGHAGRQATNLVAKKVIAPSAIKMKAGAIKAAETVEATVEQIEDAIEKMIFTCTKCFEAGFDGVQVHSAHGYLLSSFLNPLANQRTDDFGGSLENRVKPLLRIIRGVKESTEKPFAVGVKLNSSDFQKGGFTVEECVEVALMLADEEIDFLEVSGGNYENPSLLTGNTENAGSKKPEKTAKREAFFLEFAEEIVNALKEKEKKLPVMVTGGFRTAKAMNEALESGSAQLIGIGRPLCMDPACTQKLLDEEIEKLPAPETELHLPSILGWSFLQRFSMFHNLRMGASQMAYYANIIDMAEGKFDKDAKYSIVSKAQAMQALQKKNAASLKGYKEDCEYVVDSLKGK